MKLSIIVPVYNSEKYLQKCIDSLLSQKISDYEIILVNDGSTDSSEKICLEYRSKYPSLIKTFSQENKGQSSARNKGLDLAKGDYVAFVDSDDYAEENAYALCFEKAEESCADIVCFDLFCEKDGVKTQPKLRVIDDVSPKIKYMLNEASPCNKIIKRSLFEDNGLRFTEGIIYEDLELISRLALYTDKIIYIEKPLYTYVIHGNSTMRQNSYNEKLRSIHGVINTICKEYGKKGYRDEACFICIANYLHEAVLRFAAYEKANEDIKQIRLFMKQNYPDWAKNKYFKRTGIKYRIVCRLAYLGMIKTLRKMLGINVIKG